MEQLKKQIKTRYVITGYKQTKKKKRDLCYMCITKYEI